MSRSCNDFSGTRPRCWKSRSKDSPSSHINGSSTPRGKNSPDMRHVMGAMHLLQTGRLNGFALVPSDSDFARLASRIREHGLPVYASPWRWHRAKFGP